VRGHQQLWLEIVEGRDRRLDDRLEHRATQVEPTDHRGDTRLAADARACLMTLMIPA
jgi:hypothetical protein